MTRRTHPRIAAIVCLLAGAAVAAENTAETEKPKLAVVDFKIVGDVGITEAGQAVAELLLARFDTKKYQLVERTHLVKILQEHRLTMADLVSNPALVRGKKLKGVRYLVVGSIVKFGDLNISARVVDVTTGHIGRKAEVSAPDAPGLKKWLRELARVLSGDKPLPKTLTLNLGRGTTMRLVLIPAGKFLMGSGLSAQRLARQYKAAKASYFRGEFPQREVTITKPFNMGVTEVTQAQWRAVMGTEPWKGKNYTKGSGEYAASYIGWNDAAAFCGKLARKAGRTARLPTEAEWEYACRAGSTTKYCFGNDDTKLGDYAWYEKNTWAAGRKYAHPVARKKPNAWGLYDMHGNVYEWCSDWSDETYYSAGGNTVDPAGPVSGSSRVIRGGCFHYVIDWTWRSANRGKAPPATAWYGVGLRVVLPVVAPNGTKTKAGFPTSVGKDIAS